MNENQNIEYKQNWRDAFIITNGFKNEGLKIPVFETTMGSIMVTIERPGKAKKSQTKDNVTGKVPDNVVDKLTNNQKNIIEIIKINPYVSVRELAPQLGISHRKIQENIAKLKEYGIIQRIAPQKVATGKLLNTIKTESFMNGYKSYHGIK